MDDNKKRETGNENFFDENFSFDKNEKNGDVKDNGKKKEKSAMREILEWIACIGTAVVVAFFLRTYVMTIAVVDGSSMVDTLHDKERLVTWKLGYTPKKGDIVILESPVNPGEHWVKRVIATEGDEVRIDYDENKVYVNGEALAEDYINHDVDDLMEVRGTQNSLTVPEGECYVLGDNRNNSHDSRAADVGTLPVEKIEGKVVFRFFPFDKIGVVK